MSVSIRKVRSYWVVFVVLAGGTVRHHQFRTRTQAREFARSLP